MTFRSGTPSIIASPIKVVIFFFFFFSSVFFSFLFLFLFFPPALMSHMRLMGKLPIYLVQQSFVNAECLLWTAWEQQALQGGLWNTKCLLWKAWYNRPFKVICNTEYLPWKAWHNRPFKVFCNTEYLPSKSWYNRPFKVVYVTLNVYFQKLGTTGPSRRFM